MKIKSNLPNSNVYTNRSNTPQQAGDAARAQGAARPEAGVKINFSSEGILRGTALQVASTSPDIRTEKVAQLKEQVKNGTYRPDIKKAARNLLRDDLQLLKNS
ncbi:MAG: flagellar biosynthesis anti-sigma factor FlgM [Desulfovibrio sp.]